MLEFLNEELKEIDIRVDEPLKKYTYTKVGGPNGLFGFSAKSLRVSTNCYIC